MSGQIAWAGGGPPAPSGTPRAPQPANLADLLERILDKGIVIAGDIRVNLLDIELLTIKIRLLIASVDKAREMGIDWWEHDPTLSSGERDLAVENKRLRERIGELESARAEPARAEPARAEPAHSRERERPKSRARTSRTGTPS